MSFKLKIAVAGTGLVAAGTASVFAANEYGNEYINRPSTLKELPTESPLERYSKSESYICTSETPPDACNRAAAGLLAIITSEGNYTPLTLDLIDDDLEHAIVAVEDERFYVRDGAIDGKAVKRALFRNILDITDGDMEKMEGASTIAMQAADNLYPAHVRGVNSEGDVIEPSSLNQRIEAKRREVEAAKKMYEVHGREWVLEQYMNLISSRGVVGAEEVSWAFFDKSAADLSPLEAATLAAIPNDPNNLEGSTDAARNAKQMRRLAERRNLILTKMKEQGYLEGYSNEEIEAWLITLPESYILPYRSFYKGASIDKSPASRIGAEHYLDKVLLEADNKFSLSLDDLSQELVIITSLSGFPQVWLNQSVQEVSRNEPADGRQYGAVLLDQTGQIVAHIGGNYSISQVDITNAVTVGGSADKPYFWAIAIENEGLGLDTMLPEPHEVVWQNGNGNGDDYRVASGYYCQGACSVYDAIRLSSNTAILEFAKNRGEPFLQQAYDTMRKLGMTSGDKIAYPSFILGGHGDTVLNRAQAMAGLVANQGVAVDDPSYIDQIWQRTPDRKSEAELINKFLLPARTTGERVISEETAAKITEALRGVVRSGTAARSFSDFRADVDIAGKTGTHDDNVAAGFNGSFCVQFEDGSKEVFTIGVIERHLESLQSLGDGYTGGKNPARVAALLAGKMASRACLING